MDKPATARIIRLAIASVGVVACVVSITLPMRGQEVPLKQQLRGRHRLLRRVFVQADDNDVKGLAASIKADEITVRHRIRAVRYLATVDSGSYPEARQMLINTLHNDKWEEVRYEAAKALRLALAGNAAGAERTPRLFRMWLRRWRRHTRRRFRTSVRGRRDFQATCDPGTLRALVRTAYETAPNGNAFEPSLRVRRAAVNAIRDSGVACDVGPYVAGQFPSGLLTENAGAVESPGSFPTESILTPSDAPVRPEPLLTEPSRVASEVVNSDWADDWDSGQVEKTNAVTQVVQRSDSPATCTAPCLDGHCVVGLRYNKFLRARPEFRVVYQERLYEFSSAAAKAQFETDPEQYAVAYGGFDPVVYATSQEMAEGTILRQHGGFFYSFASEETWQEFQSQPGLYALRPEDLLTDEEYLAQAIQDFKELDAEAARAARASTEDHFSADAQFAPNTGSANRPAETAVAPTKVAATDTPAFDIGSLNLTPPPPVGDSQPKVAATVPTQDTQTTDDENPADTEFTLESLSDASRILGQPEPRERTDITGTPVTEPIKSTKPQPTEPSHAVARPAALEPAAQFAPPTEVVGSWSDLGLDSRDAPPGSVHQTTTPVARPQFTDSSPPMTFDTIARSAVAPELRRESEPVRGLESTRKPADPPKLRSLMQSLKSPVNPRAGERGRSSFITRNDRTTATRPTRSLSSNRFDRVLRSDEGAIRVTPITSASRSASQPAARGVSSVRISEIRKRQAPNTLTRKPAQPRSSSNSTLVRPAPKSRTRSLTSAPVSKGKVTHIKPAKSPRSIGSSLQVRDPSQVTTISSRKALGSRTAPLGIKSQR